jgi:hypothetical protein
MHTVQVAVPSYPSTEPYVFGYGMGWMTGFYKGYYAVEHGGGIDGFLSSVLLFPKEKVGVVVLTNSTGLKSALFAQKASYIIADCVMDLKEDDWLGQVEERETAVKTSLEKNIETISIESRPVRPFDDYIGEFEHPGYGVLKVCVEKDILMAALNDNIYILKHTCCDNFIGKVAESSLGGSVDCSFANNARGEISEFHCSLEPFLSPIIFKRKAISLLLSKEYLERFVGEFQGEHISVVFSFRKDFLVVTIPGQPPYELVPEKSQHFSLKGLPSFTIRFVLAEDGVIEEALFVQPNGTFSFKPISDF